MTEKPYIGVTGATTTAEVQHVISSFANAGLQIEISTHMPMVGILVSYKTLNGQPTANRRYPQ